MSITVIVPVFNQSHLTQRCLESLLKNSEIARELIVVDNHSTDDTPQLLERFRPHFESKGWSFRVLVNLQNQGFGRACNRGIRESKGSHLAILNNDTWVMPGWDSALLKNLTKLGAAMVGPHFDETPFSDLHELEDRARKFTQRNRGKVIPRWSSILMFFSRATLDQLQYFDERFFITYEDTDLRERMDRAGLTYYKVGDCYIWHFSKGTRAQKGALPSGYEQEGLRLFVEKWGFDPRLRENTRLARLKKRVERVKNRLGLLS
jgi:GT2 family glycosyltransferase